MCVSDCWMKTRSHSQSRPTPCARPPPPECIPPTLPPPECTPPPPHHRRRAPPRTTPAANHHDQPPPHLGRVEPRRAAAERRAQRRPRAVAARREPKVREPHDARGRQHRVRRLDVLRKRKAEHRTTHTHTWNGNGNTGNACGRGVEYVAPSMTVAQAGGGCRGRDVDGGSEGADPTRLGR